jgi:hypothetical protein
LVVDERSVIGTLLTDNWVDGGSEKTPISWPNRDFTPPPRAPWIKVNILPGASMRLTMGGITNVTRHTGILVIQLFDVVGNGDFTIRTLADDVAAIFRDVATDGGADEQIIFRSPYTTEHGVDGGWYQMNCNIPYIRDSLF